MKYFERFWGGREAQFHINQNSFRKKWVCFPWCPRTAMPHFPYSRAKELCCDVEKEFPLSFHVSMPFCHWQRFEDVSSFSPISGLLGIKLQGTEARRGNYASFSCQFTSRWAHYFRGKKCINFWLLRKWFTKLADDQHLKIQIAYYEIELNLKIPTWWGHRSSQSCFEIVNSALLLQKFAQRRCLVWTLSGNLACTKLCQIGKSDNSVDLFQHFWLTIVVDGVSFSAASFEGEISNANQRPEVKEFFRQKLFVRSLCPV